jgi:hypothetical protein
MALSLDKGLLVPLGSTLGLEDLWDVIEVAAVDAWNARMIEEARRREQERRK